MRQIVLCLARCSPVFPNLPEIPKWWNSGTSGILGSAALDRYRRISPISPNLGASRHRLAGLSESPWNSQIRKFRKHIAPIGDGQVVLFLFPRWRQRGDSPIPTSPRRVVVPRISHCPARSSPAISNLPGIHEFWNSGISEFIWSAVLGIYRCIFPIFPHLITSCQKFPGLAESPGGPKFRDSGNSEFPGCADLDRCRCTDPASQDLALGFQMIPGPSESLGNSEIQKAENLEFPGSADRDGACRIFRIVSNLPISCRS